MKRLILLAGLALAGCDETQMGSAPSGGGGGGAFKEFLVIGSNMSFEQCRASGGLIIRDSGSPMVACDPSVRRDVVAQEDILQGDTRAAAEATNG